MSAAQAQGPIDSTTALVPHVCEGWTLFDDTDGHHWIRDLDLAERAELVDRHDIRSTIRRAIKDGSIGWDPGGDPSARAAARCEPTIIPGTDRNDKSPGIIGIAVGESNDRPALVRAVLTTVQIGKGGAREVTEFYVNEEGALVLMGRLRTPAAIAATKQVVSVYLAVARGKLAKTAPLSIDLAAFNEQASAALACSLGPVLAELAMLRAENAESRGVQAALGVALVQANAKLDSMLESSTSGKVSGEQIARFKSEVARLTDGWVRLRWSKHLTRKSAGGEILSDIYKRAGCSSITQMLASEFGTTMDRIADMQRFVDRAERANNMKRAA